MPLATKLDTADRILAIMVRVMATILEKVENHVCLEQLHALPAVEKTEKTFALTKGLKSWFGKDEQRDIISAVCDINHAIFDVTHIAGSDSLAWPLIDVGAESIHPLRDPKVTESNQESTQYIGYYPMQWSFGADILKSARGICTNTAKNHFIVGDFNDKNLKAFDIDGDSLNTFKVDHEGPHFISDVATDHDNNVYVLCLVRGKCQVRIFDKSSNMHCSFVVELEASHLAAVEKSSKQVLVLNKRIGTNWNFVVNVYEADGTFTRSFPADDQFAKAVYLISITGLFPPPLGTPWDKVGLVSGITACNDGRVMVLDRGQVYVFSAEGDCLHKFSEAQQTNGLKEFKAGAILWTNKHVTVVSICRSGDNAISAKSSEFDVSIYRENGELVYHFLISPCYRHDDVRGITMNSQGRIALALSGTDKSEILVF